ncbi:MAG: glycosyltransferase, partial [Chthoniobacterales bacterium]|nr:glycosyltransferase [Chthoniobacterales bacterium]
DEIVGRERPDILESADPYQLGWKAAAISRRQRIPAVTFYHSDFAEAYLRPNVERLGRHAAAAVMTVAHRYVRELYNQFEVTITPSDQLAAQLREWGVRDVQVVGLGVNTEVFRPAAGDAPGTLRATYNISRAARLLIYVGRLAPEKNTGTLFEVFELLTKRHPGRFHLLVIGDGQQRDSVLALQASTRSVTWLPYCADAAELASLYRAADLFVHPGTQETFGLVALESQACGTPVVGIRGGAMEKIVFHDQSAWARQNSPQALADAVEDAMRFDLPAMGAAAAEAVAGRYAWREVFARLFCIYREVCAGYKRRAVE